MGQKQAGCPNSYNLPLAYEITYNTVTGGTTYNDFDLICLTGSTSGSYTYYTYDYPSNDQLKVYFPDTECCNTAKTIGTWLIVIFVVVPTLCVIGCIIACVICCRRRQETLLIQGNQPGVTIAYT